MGGRLLVVEDDAAMRQLLEEELARRGYTVVGRPDAESALAALTEQPVDLVVTDLNLRGGTNGVTLCQRIIEQRPDVPVLVITAFGSLESAVAAIRAGAYDFITKPFELDALTIALERALQHRALRLEVRRLREAAGEPAAGDLLGESPAMRRARQLLARVSDTDSSVLISGESGTGKEVVARWLHDHGRRKTGPFVAVNCAAMPEALLESELFGHAKGAFTDAKTARVGLFQKAAGGTLFLDEIGELPLGLQPKLLRALQERTVRPVGGDAEVPYDARIISASNRDLEQAVEEHRFREDLFFRINVITVSLPPLRSRGNDVLQLAQHFLRVFAERAGKKVTGLSAPAAQALLRYHWPGNVRELQNSIERAVALTEFEQLTLEDLPEKVKQRRPSEAQAGGAEELLPLDEVERRHILRVLRALNGHRTQAAQVLGLDRKTLYRKLERYGEDEDGPRPSRAPPAPIEEARPTGAK